MQKTFYIIVHSNFYASLEDESYRRSTEKIHIILYAAVFFSPLWQE